MPLYPQKHLKHTSPNPKKTKDDKSIGLKAQNEFEFLVRRRILNRRKGNLINIEFEQELWMKMIDEIIEMPLRWTEYIFSFKHKGISKVQLYV